MVRALSSGKLSSCREGAQRSGIQICLLAEDEVLKQCLFQKMCCLCSLCAHLHRLVSEGPRTQDGSLTCSRGQSPPMWLPLLWRGRCPDVCSLKKGSVPGAVLLLPVPEAVSLLQSTLSPVHTGLRGTWDTRWLPHLLWRSEPSYVVTSPLVGKAPECLQPKTGLVPEAVSFLPVPEAVSLLQSVCSPSAVHSSCICIP